MSTEAENRVREILATVKPLAAEYYRLTGKPLGVTGEVAEYVAAQLLGLQLAPPRTKGYDALRGEERIQIKGRAYGKDAKPGQRMSRIKIDAPCDTVLLVLLDNATLEPREMWEAPFASVATCLARPDRRPGRAAHSALPNSNGLLISSGERQRPRTFQHPLKSATKTGTGRYWWRRPSNVAPTMHSPKSGFFAVPGMGLIKPTVAISIFAAVLKKAGSQAFRSADANNTRNESD